MLVYHCFEKPEELVIPTTGEWVIEKSLYDASVSASDGIRISEHKEIFGNVFF